MKPHHFIPVIAALVLAYPLSAGPVLGWNVRHIRSEEVLKFYLPLIATSPSLREIMLAYIHLWLPNGMAADGTFE